MHTVVITGGAGFIGSNLAHYIKNLTNRYRIIIFDKLTYAGNLINLSPIIDDDTVKFVYGDVSSVDDVRRLLYTYRPSTIFNLAAESHVDRSISGDESFVVSNVLGTFRMLEESRLFWNRLPRLEKSVFKFIQISTDEVYGSLGSTGKFNEYSNYAPNSPYSASKASADHFARAYFKTYGFPVIITHCSNNYGPHQHTEKFIPTIINSALKGKKIPVYGKGTNVRDWLYVKDHCDALYCAAAMGVPGETYNFGGNMELSNLEVVRAVLSNLNSFKPSKKKYSDLIEYVSDRPGHDFRYAVDITTAKEHLDWEPKTKFHAGIQSTIAWYLQQAAIL
jgi:dTDP-glucose 4,6-dehydratase